MEKACENCVFFEVGFEAGNENEPWWGKCRRYAPRGELDTPRTQACWPKVSKESDWCGEFVRKNE